MLHLEDGVNKEAFRVAVIAAKRQHFADNAATWPTLDMDDKIDGSAISASVSENVLCGWLRVTRLAKR